MDDEDIPEILESEHVFWDGVAHLNAGVFSGEVKCRVFLTSSISKDLRIEVANQFGFAALGLIQEDPISITIPGIPEAVSLILSGTTVSSTGENVLLFATKRSPLWMRKVDSFSRGRTLLVNFAYYRLSAAQRTGFDLRGGGWKLRLIPVSGETLAVPDSMQSMDYRITHQVEFSREDGGSFTFIELEVFLEGLHCYLSFCRGRWVGISCTTLVDQSGEVVAEEWGTGKVSVWHGLSSWVGEHHGLPILELFDSFMNRVTDESWRDQFLHVVYWFQRAKTDNAGADGACILLQASLERFSWHLLVRDGKSLSASAFKRLSAAEQIRRLLMALSIPATIPSGLSELCLYAANKNLDGPDVFTRIRNRLVHPPTVSKTKEKVPYYEAYLMAKWYLELAILSVCGYQGIYSNRTRAHRWVGQVEKVPWAQ